MSMEGLKFQHKMALRYQALIQSKILEWYDAHLFVFKSIEIESGWNESAG